MKKFVLLALAAVICASAISCNVGKGCPSDGRNVGAEKLLGGDKKTMKAVKKAPKFKQGKF